MLEAIEQSSSAMKVDEMDEKSSKMETYLITKDIAKRNTLLKQLVFDLPKTERTFF